MYCLFHSVVYTEFVKPFGGLPLFSSFYLVIFSLYVVITCSEAVRLHPVADKHRTAGGQAIESLLLMYGNHIFVWSFVLRFDRLQIELKCVISYCIEFSCLLFLGIYLFTTTY